MAMLAGFPDEAAARAAALIVACYERAGKVRVCGNGDSAMETQHLVSDRGFPEAVRHILAAEKEGTPESAGEAASIGP